MSAGLLVEKMAALSVDVMAGRLVAMLADLSADWSVVLLAASSVGK